MDHKKTENAVTIIASNLVSHVISLGTFPKEGQITTIRNNVRQHLQRIGKANLKNILYTTWDAEDKNSFFGEAFKGVGIPIKDIRRGFSIEVRLNASGDDVIIIIGDMKANRQFISGGHRAYPS